MCFYLGILEEKEYGWENACAQETRISPVCNVHKPVESSMSHQNSYFDKTVKYTNLYRKISTKKYFFPKDLLTTISQKFSFLFIFWWGQRKKKGEIQDYGGLGSSVNSSVSRCILFHSSECLILITHICPCHI